MFQKVNISKIGYELYQMSGAGEQYREYVWPRRLTSIQENKDSNKKINGGTYLWKISTSWCNVLIQILERRGRDRLTSTLEMIQSWKMRMEPLDCNLVVGAKTLEKIFLKALKFEKKSTSTMKMDIKLMMYYAKYGDYICKGI